MGASQIQKILPVQLKKTCIPIISGQLLSILIGLTAICNGLLSKYNINLPLAINFPHYFILFLFYGVPYLCFNLFKKLTHSNNNNNNKNEPISNTLNYNINDRTITNHNSNPITDNEQIIILPNSEKTFMQSLLVRFSFYSLVAIIDVHANWSIVTAYAYTSVTSIQSLDCITIPTVVLSSYFFLSYRYTWNHYIGIISCLIGTTGMILTDYFIQSSNQNIVHYGNTSEIHLNQLYNSTINNQLFTAKQIIFGDFLVIIGAISYGLSNVLQQYLVLKYGIVEFLSCVGLTASIITLIYTISIEKHSISMVLSNVTSIDLTKVTSCFTGYALAMFLLYSLMPLILMRSSAILVNLSLLTSDVYAVLMDIFIFHHSFHYSYILCFIIILLGVGVFNVNEPVITDKKDQQSNCFHLISRKTKL
ncbi:unnamed protein product [Schistosoma margrebowiei]|uniref:Solute carrier family 35 member F1 n=1 Tax=Schistosoma margrebowiei TaxID=48269 RepID=A0A183LXG7_9TREM|nr:unnamed protein product [Schistosoma margrebowiei]VDO81695.1 unnamed protein product [Schistosoma margrebowiei]